MSPPDERKMQHAEIKRRPLSVYYTLLEPPNGKFRKGAHMKTITRSTIYLPMAAIILTTVVALPAAAQKQVPFKGVMQGHDSDTGSTATTVTVFTMGTGIGTLLGNFTFTQTVTVNITTGHDTGLLSGLQPMEIAYL
jgi:hypothetical protein